MTRLKYLKKMGWKSGRFGPHQTRIIPALLAAVGLCACVGSAQAADRHFPAYMPRHAKTEWAPSIFDYDKPRRLDVTSAPPDTEWAVLDTRQEWLVFRDISGDKVPVILTMPESKSGRSPVVILIHGFGGDSTEITRRLAPALVEQGFACLAFDLPFHGKRRPKNKPPKEGFKEFLPEDQPERGFRNVVQAVINTRQLIDLADDRNDLDTSNGVGMIGYSMGSWLGTLTASADRRVKALILMAGGLAAVDPKPSKPEPFSLFKPKKKKEDKLLAEYVTLRPHKAIPEFAPRPVLLQNGKRDALVPKERVRHLFRAARHPKNLRWYDAGHLLPKEAYPEAAEWLIKQWQERPERYRRR